MVGFYACASSVLVHLGQQPDISRHWHLLSTASRTITVFTQSVDPQFTAAEISPHSLLWLGVVARPFYLNKLADPFLYLPYDQIRDSTRSPGIVLAKQLANHRERFRTKTLELILSTELLTPP